MNDYLKIMKTFFPRGRERTGPDIEIVRDWLIAAQTLRDNGNNRPKPPKPVPRDEMIYKVVPLVEPAERIKKYKDLKKDSSCHRHGGRKRQHP